MFWALGVLLFSGRRFRAETYQFNCADFLSSALDRPWTKSLEKYFLPVQKIRKTEGASNTDRPSRVGSATRQNLLTGYIISLLDWDVVQRCSRRATCTTAIGAILNIVFFNSGSQLFSGRQRVPELSRLNCARRALRRDGQGGTKGSVVRER